MMTAHLAQCHRAGIIHFLQKENPKRLNMLSQFKSLEKHISRSKRSAKASGQLNLQGLIWSLLNTQSLREISRDSQTHGQKALIFMSFFFFLILREISPPWNFTQLLYFTPCPFIYIINRLLLYAPICWKLGFSESSPPRPLLGLNKLNFDLSSHGHVLCGGQGQSAVNSPG